MGTRGRPSSKSLEIAAPSPVEVVDRIRPPHQLTDEEVEIWHAVVASEPADWFRPSQAPLLAQYCRHTVQSNRVAALIERATSDPNLDPSDYSRLLHMQQRETMVMTSVATKLRITNQSLINHRGNNKSRISAKPWEFT